MEKAHRLSQKKSGLITGSKTGLSNRGSIISLLLLVLILIIGLPS